VNINHAAISMRVITVPALLVPTVLEAPDLEAIYKLYVVEEVVAGLSKYSKLFKQIIAG